MTSESRDTVSQEIRLGAGVETGGFVKEKLAGATVQRLISYGDLFAGLADVAVRFKASHAQCDGSVPNDSVVGNFSLGKRSRASILPATATVPIKPSAR